MRPRKPKPPLYHVLVWDHESQDWITHPEGGQEPRLWVGDGLFKWWAGPFPLWQVRQVLRMLMGRGYDTASIFVGRVGWEEEYATKAKPFGEPGQLF